MCMIYLKLIWEFSCISTWQILANIRSIHYLWTYVHHRDDNQYRLPFTSRRRGKNTTGGSVRLEQMMILPTQTMDYIHDKTTSRSHPSEHEMLKQWWFYVGPASQTLDQHKTNIGSTLIQDIVFVGKRSFNIVSIGGGGGGWVVNFTDHLSLIFDIFLWVCLQWWPNFNFSHYNIEDVIYINHKFGSALIIIIVVTEKWKKLNVERIIIWLSQSANTRLNVHSVRIRSCQHKSQMRQWLRLASATQKLKVV